MAQSNNESRGGRPVALTAAALLAYYQQCALDGPNGYVVAWTRSEVARRLDVSTDTIGRREAELAATGAMRRDISCDRQRSSVILLGTLADVDTAATKLSALQEGAPARGSRVCS